MSKIAVVESHFEYKGHDCICIFNCRGYRCGYVSVDDNRDFWDYDLDCHCGLSFGATPLTKDFNPKSDMYIGFDCGHICDGSDYDTALKYGLITEKRYNELVEMEIQSPTFCNPLEVLNMLRTSAERLLTSWRQGNEYIFRKLVNRTNSNI